VADARILQTYRSWQSLPAVRSGRVYAVNGSAYFSRPGPRVVSSLELLAHIIHPRLFAGYFPEQEFVKIELSQSIASV